MMNHSARVELFASEERLLNAQTSVGTSRRSAQVFPGTAKDRGTSAICRGLEAGQLVPAFSSDTATQSDIY